MRGVLDFRGRYRLRSLNSREKSELNALGMVMGITEYSVDHPSRGIYYIQQPECGIFISEEWDRAIWLGGRVDHITKLAKSLRVHFKDDERLVEYVYPDFKNQRKDILFMKVMAGLTALALALIPINVILYIITK